jgi:nucleotide-binding universal stress UspA family protein
MILCGTDLSEASRPALEAAAALARKHTATLLLVVVTKDGGSSGNFPEDLQLEREASALRQALGITIETLVVQGIPEQKLLHLAKERSADLIVVGARGGGPHSRRLGSVAEQLCQRAEVPVFVVKNAETLVPWRNGERLLRVVVGSGLGDASRSALEYVASWPELDITVVHVAWPFGEHYRLGVGGPMPLDHLRPEIHDQLLGELGRWTSESRARGPMKLAISAGFGRIDCHLAEIASSKGAELLVVGSHQRNLASRLWQGSVSRSALHEADCNVLCVPQSQLRPRVATAPRTIVIPTDFSVLADRAIPYGYSLVGPGGTVHLVHVVSSLSEAKNEPELLARLAARIPEPAATSSVGTELHVVHGSAPWLAIWQHASHANADVICMATHTRDAVKSLVLGSQAHALLQNSRIPVLLVPPDRES